MKLVRFGLPVSKMIVHNFTAIIYHSQLALLLRVLLVVVAVHSSSAYWGRGAIQRGQDSL